MGWAEDAALQAVRGHGALQKPAELATLLRLADRLMPWGSAILEIGCEVGGSLYAWAEMPTFHPRIGVTMPEWQITKAREPNWHGTEMIFGDSHDPDTVEKVRDVLAGRELGLLFIDADHHLAAVEEDYWIYRSLVSPGGLIALHDVAQHADGYSEVDIFWNALQGLKLEIVTPPRDVQGIGLVLV